MKTRKGAFPEGFNFKRYGQRWRDGSVGQAAQPPHLYLGFGQPDLGSACCILERLLKRNKPFMAAISSTVAAVPASAKTNTIMLAVNFLLMYSNQAVFRRFGANFCVTLSKMASLVGKGARQRPGVAALEAVIIQRPTEPKVLTTRHCCLRLPGL